MKGQKKTHSLFESFANVGVGYGVAIGSQLVIFPFYGIYIPFKQNLAIGLFFTIISIGRSYFLRRVFNQAMVRSNDPQKDNL